MQTRQLFNIAFVTVVKLAKNHPLKRRITVAKFGGGVIGEYGQGIPLIVNRVQTIRKRDGIGPVVVVSAPKGLTNRIIEIGKGTAAGLSPDVEVLMEAYQKICDQHIREPFKRSFLDRLRGCFEETKKALERVGRNREFEGGDRAIVLAYSGELLMSIAMCYVLKSHGVEAYNMPFSEWPLITDKNFESATFLPKESRRRIHHLVKKIEEGKVVTMGGFVGKTISGRETNYERGGSDRTAIDLGVLLKPLYEVSVDLEKESVVMSADPNVQGIKTEELEKIKWLSYNEARLAGQYGMKIVDPVAIRDVPQDVDLVLQVTNIFTGEKTIVQRHPEDVDENPLKIVTGRKNCAVLELKQSKSASLYDFLEGVRRYFEFTELRPYTKSGVRIARFLFFDGNYLRENLINDLQRIDAEAMVEYGLAAVTLVGDRMAQASGVAASAYEGIKESFPDLVILDGDIQRPTSSILIIIRERDKDRCVSAVHGKRREINKK